MTCLIHIFDLHTPLSRPAIAKHPLIFIPQYCTPSCLQQMENHNAENMWWFFRNKKANRISRKYQVQFPMWPENVLVNPRKSQETSLCNKSNPRRSSKTIKGNHGEQFQCKKQEGYRTTQTGYGTTSVWCRAGSRNVEGCWGFPCLKIEQLLNFHFMLFDRYEIHIRDFGELFNHFLVPLFDFQLFKTSKFQNFKVT